MTDLDQLADVIVAAVQFATAPLLARLAVLEARQIPEAVKGDAGPGVANLVISAEGRLLAFLTDGRSIDAGPLPMREAAKPEAPPQTTNDVLTEGVEILRDAVIKIGTQISEIAEARKQEESRVRAVVEEMIAGLPDVTQMLPLIDAAVTEAVKAIPLPANGRDGIDGKDGSSVTLEDMTPLIDARIADAVKQIPIPQNGKDGEKGEPGRDGSSITVEDMQPLVDAAVTEAVKALPIPQRGKDGKDGEKGRDGSSVTIDDVTPFIASEVEKAVAALPKAKDGRSVSDALINQDNHLVLTFSDGGTKDVGPVVGRDGVNIDPADVKKVIEGTLAQWPKPKDGKDGIDGLGFDDLEFEQDADGRLWLKFVRGETVKRVRVPCVIDRGVFKEGETYEQGDGATWGGSFWIAQERTTDKPGTSKAWRLAVKKGAEGKAGKNGIDGRPGRDGKDGAPGR